MTISTNPMRGLYTVLGCGLILGLVGCDYWPPALQAQIEQMRSETQTLTMEKFNCKHKSQTYPRPSKKSNVRWTT
ncbi:MAG: hypothetical protein HC938_10400 [Nitrospira sp.]|nr:hypothetical protein [Nitrospira sp.]